MDNLLAVPADKRLKGMPYLEFLQLLASRLSPRSYLEIGTRAGASLAQVKCDAICVDPQFEFGSGLALGRKRTLLYQMTSDEFFANNDPRAVFPGGIDLAFLDGLHRFEYLLRDFIGTERCCHAGSIVLIHDCLPLNYRMAERTMRRDDAESPETWDAWTGDVWRLLPIVKKYRPDLRVLLLDCPPTGLVALTNLDPTSDVLVRGYYRIVDEFSAEDLEQIGLDTVWSTYPLVDSRAVAVEDRFTAMFPPFGWHHPN